MAMALVSAYAGTTLNRQIDEHVLLLGSRDINTGLSTPTGGRLQAAPTCLARYLSSRSCSR
jgi:hypothetical protein